MLSDTELDLLLEAMGQRSASEELIAAWQEEMFGEDAPTAAEIFAIDVMRAEWLQLERAVLKKALSLFSSEEQVALFDLHTSSLMGRWSEAIGQVTEEDEKKFERLLERYAERLLANRGNVLANFMTPGKKVIPS